MERYFGKHQKEPGHQTRDTASPVDNVRSPEARTLVGIEGYITNLAACPDGTPVTPRVRDRLLPQALRDREVVQDGKSNLRARQVYHRKRDSIEAHLTIVFAALAVSRWIEAQTGWSIRKFVRTARPYRTIQVQVDQHVITAAGPLPDNLRQALDAINRAN